ncbi:helix-turn-helix domain-containing protein [Bdellovibrio sp. HCB-162]|uniref:AlbA family DNA-binding domain-containing protein n=1 Tax=Bdellovibrio sp. HCB-162 TaxID=3394234 RepID=UPI0039BCEAD4
MIHLLDINSIQFSDIEKLIKDAIPESTFLDYKQELPSGKDADKKDFVADLASFANKDGGIIIYGISEKRDDNGGKTGLPDSIVDLPTNTDDHIKRFEDYARSYILPRISQLQVKEIASQDNKKRVLIVKIPKSHDVPHVVRFNSDQRFHRRGNSGKYEMDLPEIRQAFISSGLQMTQIKKFREYRVNQIDQLDTPVKIERTHTLIVHFFPTHTFGEQLYTAKDLQEQRLVPQFLSRVDNHRIHYNLDGTVLSEFPNTNSGESSSYLQLYRSGGIESVDTFYLRPFMGNNIHMGFLCERLLFVIQSYLRYARNLNLSGQFYIGVTLLKVSNFSTIMKERTTSPPQRFDRDLVMIPEVIITDDYQNVDIQIKPLLDMLCNAAGFQHCFFYNTNGRFDQNLLKN